MGCRRVRANHFQVQSGSISAILAGTEGLSKTTAGTVTLSGTNTYSGTTTIRDRKSDVEGSAVLSDSTAVSITGGGTLDIGAFSDMVASLTTASGSVT